MFACVSKKQMADHSLVDEVTDARSLEVNALKTKSRAIYANLRNIAQHLFYW